MVVAMVFWLLSLVVVIAYGGYVFLLWLCPPTDCTTDSVVVDTKDPPLFISFILAFHNEALAAQQQIPALLAWPDSNFEVIVVSDGSTDQTNAHLASYDDKRLEVIEVAKQQGKIHAHKQGVQVARGDVLVFMDAMTVVPDDLLDRLRTIFQSRSDVGCVGMQLVLPHDEQTGALRQGLGVFWRFEALLRTLESNRAGLVGVSGACYALRRSLFRALPAHIQDDFAAPLLTRDQGMRAIYEPSIEVIEQGLPSHNQAEFVMRRRVALGSLSTLFAFRHLMNVGVHGVFAMQLICHKLLRHCVPFALIGICITNGCLWMQSDFYAFSAIMQLLFYTLAALGAYLDHQKKSLHTIVSAPYYFVLANAAHLAAWYDYLTQKEHVLWTPDRR